MRPGSLLVALGVALSLLLAGCRGGAPAVPPSAPPSSGGAMGPGAPPPPPGASTGVGAPSDGPSEHGIRFDDATESSGLGAFRQSNGTPEKRHLVESVGGGVALFDADLDGDLDAYLTNGSRLEPWPADEAPPRDALFRNDGRGAFSDVTAEAGLGDTGWTLGVTVADYDNDGRPDIYLTSFGPNVLLHGEADGTFRDVTARAGVGDRRWSSGASFFDADGDRDLDLFVPNYVDFDPDFVPTDRTYCEYRGIMVAYGPRGLAPSRDTFYVNDGGGRFHDATAAAGFGDERYGFQSLALDWDEDGDVDLFVANDSQPNQLWINDGKGRFADKGMTSGLALSADGRPQASMGAAAGDFDGDLRLDLFNTHFSEDHDTLYQGRSRGFAEDVSHHAGVAATTMADVGWGTGFFDADNDGDADIFVANGHVYPQVDQFDFGTSYLQRNRLFENLGNGRFRDVTAVAGPGLVPALASRGAAFGDVDDDGDVDILVGNLDGPPTLLRNETARQGHWIQILLEGTASPRDAIGARVIVTASGKSQTQPVLRAASFLSSSDPRLHFGLGPATTVDSVEIRWPSGRTEHVTGLAADARYRIVEGRGAEPLAAR